MRSLIREKTGGIAIGSFGNLQGGYKFLSIETGRVVTGYKWTIVPISEKIIEGIHELAINQPEGIILGDDDDFSGVHVHNTNNTNEHENNNNKNNETEELTGVLIPDEEEE